jgi:hypothetical protein
MVKLSYLEGRKATTGQAPSSDCGSILQHRNVLVSDGRLTGILDVGGPAAEPAARTLADSGPSAQWVRLAARMAAAQISGLRTAR